MARRRRRFPGGADTKPVYGPCKTVWKTENLFGAWLPAISEEGKGRIVRFHYDDTASLNVPAARPATAWQHSAWDEGSDWNGTRTMREAIELATNGWIEGAHKAHELREGINAKAPKARMLRRHGMAGATPNVARMLAGNPEHMRILELRAASRTPVLSLVIDIANSSMIDGEEMLAHSAAAAALVDMLEDRGYRCELFAGWRAQEAGNRIVTEIMVRVKMAERSANLGVVAYALGHPAMLRRHGFAVVSAAPECAPLGSYLGYPLELSTAGLPAGTFVLPPASTARHATAGARFVALVEALRKQGCQGVPEAEEMRALAA